MLPLPRDLVVLDAKLGAVRRLECITPDSRGASSSTTCRPAPTSVSAVQREVALSATVTARVGRRLAAAHVAAEYSRQPRTG